MTIIRAIGFLLLFSYAVCPQQRGESTQTDRAKNLTRAQVVISNDKSSVYLCFDEGLRKGSRDADVRWLRIFNNTIWTVRFKAANVGTELKAVRLANGAAVTGLTDKSIIVPQYEVEDRDGRHPENPNWGDVWVANFLPSNTSALFSVPAGYLKNRALFVEYRYEWEFIGSIAQESDAPVHRVYLRVTDLSDLSGHLCR